MKSMMYALVMALFLFASCSKDEDVSESGKVNAEQVAKRFKSIFYKDGEVNAQKMEGFTITEWAVCAEESGRACEIFESITGEGAPLTEQYDYTYISPEGSCSIRLVGNARADKDAVYAVFYVQIPSCPELSKIYVATREYFNNEEGVPVI